MKDPGLVIIGNGGAAAHAAMAARTAGFAGAIHMISDTDGLSFNPMLSPYYLQDKIPWERCFPFGQEFYQKYEIIRHFGALVDRLDPANKEIILAKGDRLGYDRCLVATGALPVVPPVPGLKSSSRTLTLRTPESTQCLKVAVSRAKRAVVLGASLVGLKVAEVLRKRRIEVILVDVAAQILPNGAHPASAKVLREYFANQGIDIRLGCGLEGLESDSKRVSCHFPDNIVEEGDFVVVCTGIKPCLEYLDPAKFDTQAAIPVDEKMRTGVQDLYAAGDVSQGMDLLTGKKTWFPLWGNACYQGRVAGLNMAGVDASYFGTIPQHVSPFFEWTFAQIGEVDRQGPQVRTISNGDPAVGRFSLLAFDQGRLVGVNLINGFQNIGRFKTAILRQLDWSRYLEEMEGGPPENIVRVLEILLQRNEKSLAGEIPTRFE